LQAIGTRMADTSPVRVLLSNRRNPAWGGIDSIDIASRLREWQDGSDPRLWKLIISPKFGERLDLRRLTRDVMSRMGADLHTSLEWVAVSHFNTEHPHVHVALRGVDASGEAFKSSWIGITSEMASVP